MRGRRSKKLPVEGDVMVHGGSLLGSGAEGGLSEESELEIGVRMERMVKRRGWIGRMACARRVMVWWGVVGCGGVLFL